MRGDFSKGGRAATFDHFLLWHLRRFLTTWRRTCACVVTVAALSSRAELSGASGIAEIKRLPVAAWGSTTYQELHEAYG
jgi:hypothetical protein